MTNPYLIAFRAALPYLLAALSGFGAAWWLQGLNVTAAENDRDKVTNQFAAYRTEQTRLTNEATAKADQLRQEAADAWNENLKKVLADKGAFERCVAAGRCGPRRVCVALPVSRPAADGQAPAVPAAPGTDGDGGGGPIHASDGAAAEVSEVSGLIEDCARTQLKLNTLRDDIRKQPLWAQ